LNSDPQVNFPSAPGRAAFPVRDLALLLAVAGLLFFAWLGRLPLIEPDEGRNAEVAREMLATGDFITPHFNTLTYLDKPAAYFWMVAGSFRVAGVNEWAARLPSALMALATMLLVWFLARRMFGDGAGLRAGLAFATAPLVIVYSRYVIFDMTLAFLVCAAMVSYWQAQASNFRRPLLDMIFFAALGVAAITKGPVGFLLPLLSVLTFAGITGRWRDLRRLRWGLGVLVFLAAALPWFLAVSMRNPGFPRYAFWQESLQRFATSSTRRGGSIFYYLPVYLGGYLPWSIFLLYAGLTRLKLWRRMREESDRPTAYLVSWAAVVLIFFTISRSKLPGYFLPAVAPLSILTAKVWEDFETLKSGRPRWLGPSFLTLAALGIVVAVLPQAFRWEAVAAAANRKIPPAALALLKPSLFYSGLVLAALGILGRNLTRHSTAAKSSLFSLALLAMTVPLLLVRWAPALEAYANVLSSRRLAQAIQNGPERDLPVYGYYCFRTGLPFYLQRPVNLVTTDASELTSNYVAANLARMRQETTAAGLEPVLSDPQNLRERVQRATRPILVMVRVRDTQKLFDTVPNAEPLWTEWEHSIWKIPPGRNEEVGSRK
jgi:4-amino-4-deoxy-L-arabinose transferase-like glycosyltransferase